MIEDFIGQWQGFFKYGPEYGPMIENKEAEFRMFVETFHEGQFAGRVIDWDGFGADGEVADVKGFIEGNHISFTKQYKHAYFVDDWGNSFKDEKLPGFRVEYEGSFDSKSNEFSGTWEIAKVLEHTPESTLEELVTGTWRMHLQPKEFVTPYSRHYTLQQMEQIKLP